MIYKCGHCGFIGYCYGIPTSQGVSALFCSNCQMNDKLEEVENESHMKDSTTREGMVLRIKKVIVNDKITNTIYNK